MIYLHHSPRILHGNAFNSLCRPVKVLLNTYNLTCYFDVIFLSDVISSIGPKISDADTSMITRGIKFYFTPRFNKYPIYLCPSGNLHNVKNLPLRKSYIFIEAIRDWMLQCFYYTNMSESQKMCIQLHTYSQLNVVLISKYGMHLDQLINKYFWCWWNVHLIHLLSNCEIVGPKKYIIETESELYLKSNTRLTSKTSSYKVTPTLLNIYYKYQLRFEKWRY